MHRDCSSFQETDLNITEYFEAVQRLLKVGGRYICFSFATTDILDKLLDCFSSGWFFRVHMLNTDILDGKSVPLPLFCFVLTKTKLAGECTRLLWRCIYGESETQGHTIEWKEDKIGVIFFGRETPILSSSHLAVFLCASEDRVEYWIRKIEEAWTDTKNGLREWSIFSQIQDSV